MFPAVAVKPTEATPAATDTEPGTDRAVELLDSVTVVTADAARFRPTVQVVVPFDASVEAPHTREDTASAGAVNAIGAACDDVPREAVTVAV